MTKGLYTRTSWKFPIKMFTKIFQDISTREIKIQSNVLFLVNST